MTFKRILTVVGVLALAAIPSFADVAFIVPPSSPGQLDWGLGSAVNLGMIFSPSTDISVVGLGTYYQDAGGNTPGQIEVVELFQNSTQNVLASATIVFTAGAPGYQYNPIAPVTLLAGQQYTVDTFVGNNSWAWSPQPLTDPNITFVDTSYVYGPSPAFPVDHYPAGGYYGPNLEFAVVTPEPGFYSIFALFALALTGLFAAMRRRQNA